MSIESKIDTLNATMLQLIQAVTALVQVQTSGAASVHQNAAPVATQPPAPVASPAPAPQMPAPPNFMAPPAAAPAPAQSAVPFTDLPGLFKYCSEAYQMLGAEKGQRIQTQVMAGLGVSNVNDIKPEQFAQFFAGVEALKAGA